MAFAIRDGRNQFAPAADYYTIFPHEVTKSSSVRISLPIQQIEPRTFQGLAWSLNTWSVRRGDKDAVVILHGHMDSNRNPDGVSLPLNEQTSMLATEEVLKVLEDMLNNRMKYEKIATAAEKRFQGYTYNDAPVRMSPGALVAVFNVLVMIRHQELNRIEIRACNLGARREILEAIGRLLGAKYISAPNTNMFYVRVDAGRRMTAQGFERWVRQNPRARVFQNSSNASDLVGIHLGGRSPRYTTNSATTSANLGWFFRQFVMRNTSFLPTNNRFVVAGMELSSSNKPFVLPQEQEYRQHLVDITLPSVKPWLRGQSPAPESVNFPVI